MMLQGYPEMRAGEWAFILVLVLCVRDQTQGFLHARHALAPGWSDSQVSSMGIGELSFMQNPF